MSSVEKWVHEQQRIYELNVEDMTQNKNSFIARSLKFSDPKGDGITFSISENDSGEMSSLCTEEIYDVSRLTIAEGFKPDSLQKFAELLLTGKIEDCRTQILDRPYLLFSDTEGVTVPGTVPLLRYIFKKNEIENRIINAKKGYTRKEGSKGTFL